MATFNFVPIGDYTTCCYSSFKEEVDNRTYSTATHDIERILRSEYAFDEPRKFSFIEESGCYMVSLEAGVKGDAWTQTWRAYPL